VKALQRSPRCDGSMLDWQRWQNILAGIGVDCTGSELFLRPGLGISAVEIHPRQRQVEVRLTFRFVVRWEDSLRFVLIARLKARLNASDFVFEVKDASRTPDQTERFVSLLHSWL
jgi:hypothetical protein